jgi:hypothetical protein
MAGKKGIDSLSRLGVKIACLFFSNNPKGAIMVKLQVLQSDRRTGTSKTGKPYNFQVLKCVVSFADGTVDVGEVCLFDHPDDIKPGLYHPTFAVKRNQDGRLEGQIAGLTAINVA